MGGSQRGPWFGKYALHLYREVNRLSPEERKALMKKLSQAIRKNVQEAMRSPEGMQSVARWMFPDLARLLREQQQKKEGDEA